MPYASNLDRQAYKRRRYHLRKSKGLCGACGKPTNKRALCKKCNDVIYQRNKKRRKLDPKPSRLSAKKRAIRLKDAAFAAYGGPSCRCCDEDIIEFLTIDHINDDGAKHRKEKSGRKIYRWLKKHNYPTGFQVLCSNCQNRWKCPGRICPHKAQKSKPKPKKRPLNLSVRGSPSRTPHSSDQIDACQRP